MNLQTKFGRKRIKITTSIVYQPKKVMDRRSLLLYPVPLLVTGDKKRYGN